MFFSLYLITSLNLSHFNTSEVTDMRSMLGLMTKLKTIDLTSFDTSKVTDMRNLFSDCISLISLNVSNFNTSNVRNMNTMFKYCSSLTSLDVSNFETYNVISSENMFFSCYSLKSLNLSNFNVYKNENLRGMLRNCTSLIFVDISSFILNNSVMSNFFLDCSSLKNIIYPKKAKLKPTSINSMFSGCSSLTSLDLSFIDSSSCTNMRNFLYGCNSLTSIDLSYFDVSKVTNMKYMFYGCHLLKELDFSNFRTKSLLEIDYMFYGCTSLKSLNLSNFDTSQITNMENLFGNCIKLTSIFFGNFVTSSVENMESMFYSCNSLKSLNLSSFDTSNVKNMKSMFFGCSQLTSLDISNFNTSKVTKMNFMFINCNNLKYINFYNFDDTSLTQNNLMFHETSNNLIIYLNKKSISEKILSEIIIPKCIAYNLSINHEEGIPRIIYDKKICIDDCQKEEIYKYEYNYFCYDKCPIGTHLTDLNLCKGIQAECIKDYPFLYFEDNSCKERCYFENFFNQKCSLNYYDNETKKFLVSSIIEGIEDGLMNKLIINDVNGKKEDLIITEKDILYQITTSYNQNNRNYQNISSIELGDFEDIIKKEYNIQNKESLIIFKIEQYLDGLLIPLIEYEIFNPETKEKLDLSIFNNSNINIYIKIPIYINENELYKYDLNNSYYNDICNISFSEGETDLTLYEKKNEYFNNNLSLCLINCTFVKYDLENKQVICQCEIQDGISLFYESNKEKIINNIINLKSLTNLNIMKCYRLVFSKRGFIYNIGNYILLLIIICFISLAICFYVKGYDYLYNQINGILFIKELESKDEKDPNNIIKNVEKLKDITDITSSSKKSKNTHYDAKTNLDFSISSNILPIKKKQMDNNIKNEGSVDLIDCELNNISFDEALKIDKRTFFQYYISILNENHIIISIFNKKKDYNSFFIKICILLISISLYLVVNALFFNDSMMHKIYQDKGNFILIYNLPNIIYSVIIISIIIIILKYISLSQMDILGIKFEKNKYNFKAKAIIAIKCLIIKYIAFFIFSILFLLLFWYYLSCFCIIYKNTQVYLIKNFIISFTLFLIYPFVIHFLHTFLRIRSLKNPGKFLFKISQLIQLL